MLWNTFERLLRLYAQKNSSYQWIGYKDYSVIKETGVKTRTHTLDRDETAVLVYCDAVRTLADIQTQMQVNTDELLAIVHRLKGLGLLYYDNDFTTIISVVEAAKKVTKD